MSGSGWNRGTGAVKPVPQKKPGVMRGAIAGLAVVALLGVVAFFIFGGKDSKPKAGKNEKFDEKKPMRLSEVKHSSAPTNVNDLGRSNLETNKIENELWQGVAIKRKDVVTNGQKIVETIYTADGNVHKHIKNARRPVFDNYADQVLAVATQGNGTLPPLPMGKKFEDALGAAVRKEIVINDDDPPNVKAVKERVIQARKDLLQRMAEGERAEDVIKDQYRLQKENAAIRAELVAELRSYVEKGDLTGARSFCERMNPSLENLGITGLEVPKSREEVRAERLERRFQAADKKEVKQ